ncbi:cycloisomaltooligosaccharide glucanotransferase [Pontibacillus halophilus JSM 076056 = DSM 19796]|uniref:Cycloisomaltooligosaccharide glucanotransferase n=1 Tax=Pontibacillus halophilus JSM 076056 = DSM 19796 TaxID=1385510 RepID=A0A0A5GKY1_9BACI|nr:glycoside hydrolase family 66 protein [Pontibacillus halophilus]KGX93926.1 cycloisomaltooligosaccharide glucanotransferase [Pontibacillus halophilus JSM 076056 = DSM 19796]
MKRRTKWIIALSILILAVISLKWLPSTNTTTSDTSDITSLEIDKAMYQPGEPVTFSATLNQPSSELTIHYYHLSERIETETIEAPSKDATWTWTPPKEDYKGYLVKVSTPSSTKTIGVDVSSTWTKFPRYGFLSHFEEMDPSKQQDTIKQLNRYHINGLQYYDWHDEHHQPLKTDGAKPLSSWANIANQPAVYDTIDRYIQLADDRNMASMAYNLLYGALQQSEQDGVKPEWFMYKDDQGNAYDYHPLPENWKSHVYLTDPTNVGWQQYLYREMNHVFSQLPFDGWHIDQLGDRGKVYTKEGEPIDLASSYNGFIQNAQAKMPDQTLVMNAVNQYGQSSIAQSTVPFLYTEVWEPYQTYGDLYNIIKENDTYNKNSVLAAYMNYDLANEDGQFNKPGVLYTDALILASGGAHIELGEHMLQKEFFPHDKLQMGESLQDQLVHYYDFMVAYENLLRGDVTEAPLEMSTKDWVQLSSQPQQGKLFSFAKTNESSKIIHVLNYFDASHMKWRDSNGTQQQPTTKHDLELSIKEERPVEHVWVASPDWNGGAPSKLSFTQEEGEITVTLPEIKYWDMVVLEYK